jgi:hypothetical protein
LTKTSVEPEIAGPTPRMRAARAAVRVRGRKIWQRNDLGTYNHVDAVNNCNGLRLEGLSGWRLPTTADWLETGIRCGGISGSGCVPCLDQAVFPVANNAADQHWTATPIGTDNFLWYNTGDGRTKYDSYLSLHPVKCVHDPLP